MLSEQNDFTDFYRPLPTKIVETQSGLLPSLDAAVLWVGNQSAITTAKATDTKPKSRHYALRYLRVRDAASQIVFCPTYLMKADPLTKLECSAPQRKLILHHIDNPRLDKVVDDSDSSDEQDEDDVSYSNVVYSVFFGF